MNAEDKSRLAFYKGSVAGLELDALDPQAIKAFMDGLIRATNNRYCVTCWERTNPCYCTRDD